jgi:adenylate kinase
MIVALTGTPGTGKTSASKHLSSKGFPTRSLNDLVVETGCIIGEDADSIIVDTERLPYEVNRLLRDFRGGRRDVLLEGHLSHLVNPDLIIVLRCNPLVLKDRLKTKGWSEEKLLENLEAELVDSILIESIEIAEELNINVYEIDTTEKTVEGISETILKIISAEKAGIEIHEYLPGKIDWISVVGDRIDEVTRKIS